LTRFQVNDNFNSIPSWSPDGKRIAFVRVVEKCRSGCYWRYSIWVIDADGRHPHRITPGRDDGNPSWSPDGKRIAFVANCMPPRCRFGSAIELVDVERGKVSTLVAVAASKAEVDAPSWSPDGRTIAFTYGASGYPRLMLFDIQRRLQRSTVAKLGDTRVSWSHDGRWIAYSSLHGPLATIGRDGRPGRVLSATGPQDNLPAWSPDDTAIAYDEAGAITLLKLSDAAVPRSLAAGAGIPTVVAFRPH